MKYNIFKNNVIDKWAVTLCMSFLICHLSFSNKN